MAECADPSAGGARRSWACCSGSSVSPGHLGPCPSLPGRVFKCHHSHLRRVRSVAPRLKWAERRPKSRPDLFHANMSNPCVTFSNSPRQKMLELGVASCVDPTQGPLATSRSGRGTHSWPLWACVTLIEPLKRDPNAFNITLTSLCQQDNQQIDP